MTNAWVSIIRKFVKKESKKKGKNDNEWKKGRLRRVEEMGKEIFSTVNNRIVFHACTFWSISGISFVM